MVLFKRVESNIRSSVFRWICPVTCHLSKALVAVVGQHNKCLLLGSSSFHHVLLFELKWRWTEPKATLPLISCHPWLMRNHFGTSIKRRSKSHCPSSSTKGVETCVRSKHVFIRCFWTIRFLSLFKPGSIHRKNYTRCGPLDYGWHHWGDLDPDEGPELALARISPSPKSVTDFHGKNVVGSIACDRGDLSCQDLIRKKRARTFYVRTDDSLEYDCHGVFFVFQFREFDGFPTPYLCR